MKLTAVLTAAILATAVCGGASSTVWEKALAGGGKFTVSMEKVETTQTVEYIRLDDDGTPNQQSTTSAPQPAVASEYTISVEGSDGQSERVAKWRFIYESALREGFVDNATSRLTFYDAIGSGHRLVVAASENLKAFVQEFVRSSDGSWVASSRVNLKRIFAPPERFEFQSHSDGSQDADTVLLGDAAIEWRTVKVDEQGMAILDQPAVAELDAPVVPPAVAGVGDAADHRVDDEKPIADPAVGSEAQTADDGSRRFPYVLIAVSGALILAFFVSRLLRR